MWTIILMLVITIAVGITIFRKIINGNLLFGNPKWSQKLIEQTNLASVWIWLFLLFGILVTINPWTSQIAPTWSWHFIGFPELLIIFLANWIYIRKVEKKIKKISKPAKKKKEIQYYAKWFLWGNLILWVTIYLIMIILDGSIFLAQAMGVLRENSGELHKSAKTALDSLKPIITDSIK